MKIRILIAGVALMVHLAFAMESVLPSHEEIKSAFDVGLTGRVPTVEILNSISPLLCRVRTYCRSHQSVGPMENDALTNLFLRCCSLNFPTNDSSSYANYSRQMEDRVLPSFKPFARKSDSFGDLVLAQLPRFNYWNIPSKPSELENNLIAAAAGSGGRSVVIYRNAQTGEIDQSLNEISIQYRSQVRHIMNLNNSNRGIRRGLIQLASPMVERKAASLTDVEWSMFTNSVTITMGLTYEEQKRLFKNLKP